MERPGRGGGARLIGAFRRDRAALLVTTALTGCFVSLFALPARGQLAPDAQPKGGVVVAGSASISADHTTTTVTQGSERAAVNWQSFNVGSAATVNFVQPSTQAVTLNRVIAADPSEIAGHIHANGGIVLTNPAGVVFAHGAEVNAASVLVSAPGITDKNFMTGRMVFDIPPKPGARIVNAGRITVKSAGLAALVAPEVANSGVIAAQLGHVILAGGAAAETLDLYGDGLVSLDVTPESHTVQLANGAKATALVTNTGTIIARGGTVDLTAREADGLVQDLVDAGGTIAANSLGTHRGTIIISGIGGSIRIPGTLLAEGKAPGTTGGAIALDATGTVALPGSAQVDASGAAGGGTVAVGTTLARARGGPGTASTLTAAAVDIAPHAHIAASATDDGTGGRVTVLSLATTDMSGTISARGGPHGGNGGSVEISGENLSLDGGVDAGAPLGRDGSILLDPYNLQIVGPGQGANDTIAVAGTILSGAGDIAAGDTDTVSANVLTGNVTLQAINNLEISANLSLGSNALTAQAGNNLTVDPGVTVSAGNIEMDAASKAIASYNPTGTLIVQGTVQAGGNLTLTAGTGGIIVTTFTNPGTTFPPGSIIGNAVTLDALTGPVNTANGLITAITLSGTSIGASLTGPNNNVGTLAGYDAGTLTFNLADSKPLTVSGPVQAESDLGLEASSLSLGGGSSLNSSGGSMHLTADAGAITVNGNVVAGALVFTATGPVNDSGGSITATTLAGSSAGASLTGANTITTLGTYDAGTLAGDTFNLSNNSSLSITGSVQANGDLAIEASSLTIAGGSLIVPGGIVEFAPAGTSNATKLVQNSGSVANTLVLTNGDLVAVDASVLQIGIPTSGPITIGGSSSDVIKIPAGTLNLVSASGSAATEKGTLAPSVAGGSLELIGDVGQAALTQGNSITVLGAFTAISGGFSLKESRNKALLISGAVSVPTNDTISLKADGITIGSGGSLIAPGGTVALASATSGKALELTTGLSVASVGTFSLGEDVPTAAISAGAVVVGADNAGAITISGSIVLPNTAGLALLSEGIVSE
ncbi:MAG: filamentous hemagglutinin N-terminal domain-containing protein, partial [Acetobacteraceae bacterium]